MASSRRRATTARGQQLQNNAAQRAAERQNRSSQSTANQQRVNSRAAEVNVANQNATRAQNILNKGFQTNTTGEHGFRPDPNGGFVTTQQGVQQATNTLQRVAGGPVVNDPQQVAQFSQLSSNLGSNSAGANGVQGNLGFNPNSFSVDRDEIRGNFLSARQQDILRRAEELGIRNGGYSTVSDNIFIPGEDGRHTVSTGINSLELREARKIQEQAEREIAASESNLVQRSTTGNALNNSGLGDQNAEQVAAARAGISQQAALQGLIAGLSPEDQQIAQGLFGLVEQQNGMLNQSLLGARESLQGTVGTATDSRDAIDSILQDMGDANRRYGDQLNGLLSESRDRQLESAQEREQLELDKLSWQEEKLVREQRRNVSRQKERIAAELALTGRAFSGNAVSFAREEEARLDQSIVDLQKEFGFARTDLAVQFQELESQIHDKYDFALADNIKNLQKEESQINMQRVVNQEEFETKINAAIDKFDRRWADVAREKSANLRDLGNQITSLTMESRKAKREDERFQLQLQRDDINFQRQLLRDQIKFDQSSALANQQSVLEAQKLDNELRAGFKKESGETKKYINDQIGKLQTFKDMQKVKPLHQAALQAKRVFDENPADPGVKGAYDFALVKLFNSILEPGGRVTDGEFEAAASGAGWNGTRQQVEDWFGSGGQGVTPEAAKAMEDMMGGFIDSFEDAFNEEASFLIHDLNDFNSAAPSEFQVNYKTLKGFNLLSVPASEASLANEWLSTRAGGTSLQKDFTDAGTTSGGLSLQSAKYSGRKVTLRPEVMQAFDKANADFKAAYGVDIKIGAEASSTFRNQAKTIESMAKRVGVPYSANNPNETAENLRKLGHQIANVGFSKHERGEAIDLYPFEQEIGGMKVGASDYIALVKPFLERYGIQQANHKGIDPGNFEYSLNA